MNQTEVVEIMNRLHAAGYAVIVWTPDELEGVDPDEVEERSIEFGWAVIDSLKE
jgi:ATP-dependent Clp protease adapter protein ClpS